MYKKTVFTLLIATIFISLLHAEKDEQKVKNSFVEFPFIILVGQVVDITPHSVIVENTEHETLIPETRIQAMKKSFYKQIDFRAHAFANAMKLVSVEENHMRLNFFLDNINQVFHQEIRTYLEFLPLVYMFKNNMERLKVPKKLSEQLKGKNLNYYLSIPYIRELMEKSWFAGVFKIHPESKKLVYHDSSFFESYDDMMVDDFAREYRIPGIVRAGMTMTMTTVSITGNEASRPAEGGGSGGSGSSDSPAPRRKRERRPVDQGGRKSGDK